MGKPILKVSYDTMQSQNGIIELNGDHIYFEFLKVVGNNLVVYVSDNGWSTQGRIGGIYDIGSYNIIFNK
jgi:hypothetical protein